MLTTRKPWEDYAADARLRLLRSMVERLTAVLEWEMPNAGFRVKDLVREAKDLLEKTG